MGPLLCLLSAACFGAMGIFGKLAFDAGVTPHALLLVRFTLAALILLAVLAARPKLRIQPQSATRNGLPVRIVITAIGLGAVGYAAQAGLYFSALQRMDASLLSLILYSYPLMVTVTAAVIGREKLTQVKVLALTVASGGTLLVLLQASGTQLDGLGVLLAVGSAMTYTAYILVSDTVVRRIPPVVLSALVMTGAAVTMTVWAVFTGGVELGFAAQGWFWLSCIAVVSTVFAMLAFFAGLQRTGPSAAAILSTFEPVVTTTLAALVLGEFLTPLQLVGGVLVLSSVALLQLKPKQSASGTPLRPESEPVRTQEHLGDGEPTRCR